MNILCDRYVQRTLQPVTFPSLNQPFLLGEKRLNRLVKAVAINEHRKMECLEMNIKPGEDINSFLFLFTFSFTFP